jgi:hypothetical protein
MVSVTDPYGCILGFLDRRRFFFQVFEVVVVVVVEWTPLQTHYFSENLVVPRIEPGASESVASNSDH